MMPSPDLSRIEALFHAALELPVDERRAFLESEEADPTVRDEVEALLGANDRSGPADRFADASGARGPAGSGVEHDTEPDLAPGTEIDRYRIEGLIARGGMGAVYLARRADGQVEYQVALKILRRDLHTPTWHERFLAERQVLARTDHPGIARLLDAGATEDGRPWFAMEYIDGSPIVEYCDEHGLGNPERLSLFGRVCDAVEHAHRHLVVHRDIKPANVLVNSRGEVKLLDFGIAKVLESGEEIAQGGRTAIGLRILTPDFAAPEQLMGEPITTSTDVFQLGLLLHVLLTGQLPEPGESVGNAAPSRLPRDLRAIIAEALADAPGDRYGTVEQLSQDVRRFSAGLPVRARAGRTGYHVAKFVRRHALGVGAAATIAALVVALAVTSTVQAGRIATERDRAQEVSGLLVELFESAGPAVARGDPPDALELLDQGVERVRASASDDPELAATMFGVLADVQYDLGRYAEAADLGWEAVHAVTETAGPDEPRTVERLTRVAAALASGGMYDSASVVALTALARAPWRSGTDGAIRGQALQAQAYTLQMRGSSEESSEMLDSALALYRAAPGDSARLLLASALINRAWLHENAGDNALATSMMQESVEIRTQLLDAEHPSTLNSLGGLIALQLRGGDVDAAEAGAREVLARSRSYYGSDHPTVSGSVVSLAQVLTRRGDLDGAEALYHQVLETARPADRASVHNGFGNFLLRSRGRAREAVEHFRQAAEIYATVRGPEDEWVAAALGNQADALLQADDATEAQQTARRAIEILERPDGEAASVYLPGVLIVSGLALRELGQESEAEGALRRALAVAESLGDSAQAERAERVLGGGGDMSPR